MSDSRLEKFIYAICSMDVSDLPVPLSRIEKLWNCLITGETPDFEPLSRNEKYLMAMLDRYDISNLPAPMSRGEQLLYKIAVGETDLSDVPGCLSRYEELLKYLIENGEISEDDFEYVLYTLNQSLYTLYTTAEKPVKSAILKGQTVKRYKDNLFDGIVESGGLGINSGENDDRYPSRCRSTNFIKVEPNSTITFARNLGTDGFHVVSYNENKEFIKGFTNVMKANVLVGKINTTSDIYYIRFYDVAPTSESEFGIFQGDVEPIYELVSVKMPVLTTIGKNLFDGEIEEGQFDSNGNPSNYVGRTRSKNFIKVPKNTDLYVSIGGANNASWTTIYFYNDKKEYTNTFITMETNKTFNTKNNSYIKWKNNSQISQITNVQIEQGTAATSYEPYKSNILSTSEDVTLRGIGDVKDELDCLTGELTQRVSGLECINQNSKLSQSGTSTDTTLVIVASLKSNSTSGRRKLVASHELIKYAQLDKWFDILSIIFRLPKSNENFATLANFKQYLTQNPFYYYRELEQNEISIKTVDLTVVDQDNHPTELGTFENITHVSLVAENLIPEVEMEVATHISEELASASPLMDDISTEQQQLEATVNEQSNNVDATMIATTEIFEETL